MQRLKQGATKLKTAARSIALVLIITLPGAVGLRYRDKNTFEKKNLWITEEVLRWIVDQLCQ